MKNYTHSAKHTHTPRSPPPPPTHPPTHPRSVFQSIRLNTALPSPPHVYVALCSALFDVCVLARVTLAPHPPTPTPTPTSCTTCETPPPPPPHLPAPRRWSIAHFPHPPPPFPPILPSSQGWHSTAHPPREGGDRKKNGEKKCVRGEEERFAGEGGRGRGAHNKNTMRACGNKDERHQNDNPSIFTHPLFAFFLSSLPLFPFPVPPHTPHTHAATPPHSYICFARKKKRIV